jgi:ribosomal protein S18 acetylase RimI-like enzyme
VNLRITRALPRDARAIAALRTAVAEDMTRKHGQGHWSACPSKAEVTRQLRASHVLVARHGADIVGTVRLATANPLAFDSGAFTSVQSSLYVLGLAVAPECRNQGVGRQLMEAAKGVARARPAQALWLDAYDSDVGAGPFYVRCDFRRVGPSEHKDVSLVYYEWLAR